MSIKSRKRAERRRRQNEPCDQLQLQKQTIQNAAQECLWVAGLLLVVAVIVVCSSGGPNTPGNYGVVVAEFGVLALFTGCFLAFIRRRGIARQFDKIKYASEQTVTVRCKKLCFLSRAVSRFSSVLLCVVIVDENGNKFYYVYPAAAAPADAVKRELRQACLGCRMELVCYKGTGMIKRFLQ